MLRRVKDFAARGVLFDADDKLFDEMLLLFVTWVRFWFGTISFFGAGCFVLGIAEALISFAHFLYMFPVACTSLGSARQQTK